MPTVIVGDRITLVKIHIFRLKPNTNLRGHLQTYARKNGFSAGLVLSIVGCLKEVNLRMAAATPTKQIVKTYNEDFEIVSTQGTLSANDCHIHISVSNKKGGVIGGHLKEGVVGTTTEVALLELTDRKFLRKFDKETGFEELIVETCI